MGTYLTLRVKPGCESQINEAYAKHRGNSASWLVYSDEIIASEIRYVHSEQGRQQAHFRPYLKTVEDWHRLFPALERGTGQIKLSGLDCSDSGAKERQRIKDDISFILAHRMLFSSIDGLGDARLYGFTDVLADRIENHKPVKQEYKTVSFSELPKGRSRLYQYCVSANRADLWRAFLAFRHIPCESTWEDLRSKVVPWVKGHHTVWQLVEARASAEDGKDFGLWGRFRDGTVPSLWLVRKVLTAH